jgi:hypothetical protein
MNQSLIIALLSISFSYGQNSDTNKKETAKLPEPVIIRSSNDSEITIDAPTNEVVVEKPDYIYSSAGIEVQPEYSEGRMKFIEDFNKKFRLKVDQDLKGRIFLEFVVERNGTLSNIKVIRDLGFGSGKEAVRVIQSLPKWKPAVQEGKTLRVRYSLPLMIDIKADTDFNQYTPPASNKNIQELKDKH